MKMLFLIANIAIVILFPNVMLANNSASITVTNACQISDSASDSAKITLVSHGEACDSTTNKIREKSIEFLDQATWSVNFIEGCSYELVYGYGDLKANLDKAPKIKLEGTSQTNYFLNPVIKDSDAGEVSFTFITVGRDSDFYPQCDFGTTFLDRKQN